MTEKEWLSSDDPQVMLDLLTKSPGATPANAYGLLSAKTSDRKLRLFACGLFRLSCTLYNHEPYNVKWMTWLEDNADRPIDLGDGRRHSGWLKALCSGGGKETLVSGLRKILGIPSLATGTFSGKCVPRSAQASLSREITGNPFRPVLERPCPYCKTDPQFLASCMCKTCYPRWLTPTVFAIAKAAYDERVTVCKRCRRPAKAWEWGPGHLHMNCPECRISQPAENGLDTDGTLDPVTLGILADALLDAGMEEDHEIISHLRSPGPHVRGCWVVDLLLGKE